MEGLRGLLWGLDLLAGVRLCCGWRWLGPVRELRCLRLAKYEMAPVPGPQVPWTAEGAAAGALLFNLSCAGACGRKLGRRCCMCTGHSGRWSAVQGKSFGPIIRAPCGTEEAGRSMVWCVVDLPQPRCVPDAQYAAGPLYAAQ